MQRGVRPVSPVTRDSARAAVLLVDDDPLIVETLKLALDDEFAILPASSRAQTRRVLEGLAVPPALALIDLGLPPSPHAPDEGYALIGELLAHRPTMKILVLSGQSDRANIQHALTLGAVDFLPKPCDLALMRARLNHQLMLLDAEARDLPVRATEELLIGASAGLQTLRALIKQFANSPFPVLIEGESGAGKELVALCLHRESRRAALSLMTLNCAAFSPELLEAQLFGAAKGAYTGADRSRPGLLEAAGSGTLVLDEVSEMPAGLQSKLLRVLENGEYYRLGETQPRRADVRVIAATNRELRDAVRRGEFRSDLFHRLSVLTITVPPLRERGADWRLLFEHFLRLYRGTLEPVALTAAASSALAAYTFPGNIRELRNIVVRLGTKYGGQTVDVMALNAELEPPYQPSTPHDATDTAAALARLNAPGFSLDQEVTRFERRLVAAALEFAHGNLSQAARLLGVNRTTLYSKLARLGLSPQEEP
ncbi:MAG: sigma-54-dependent Fis family transcriptional regulator [Gammaproteobacteria bacterium]|nr:sigma-54-dependent Fis family transcriptional regulator [Gammaproteobacteria bacterium]